MKRKKKSILSTIIRMLIIFALLFTTSDISVYVKAETHSDSNTGTVKASKAMEARTGKKGLNRKAEKTKKYKKKTLKKAGKTEEYTYSVSKEKVTITSYNGDGGDIAIPDKIDEYDVVSISSSAFYNKSSITSVKLPLTLTTIGNSAFNQCRNLTSITIPASVTSIGSSAFANSIKSMKFASGMKEIPANACSGANLLESVELPLGITGIGNSAFYNCSALNSVNLPNSVVKIGSNAFYGCVALQNIIVPDGVTVIEDSTFNNCTKLAVIKISETLEEIKARAFYNCKNLVIGSLPSGLKLIGSSAFQNCTKVEEITVPSTVTDIGSSAFANSVKKLKFSSGMTEIPANACSGANLLETVELPLGITGIGNSAFYNCSVLNSVNLPNSVIKIGNNAFYGCAELQNIIIPDGVTAIEDNTFYNCTKLATVKFSGALEEIKVRAFYNCKNLEVSDLPSQLKVIGNGAFQNCTKVEVLTIPSSTISIGNSAFANSVKILKFANGMIKIPVNACSGANLLETVELPSSITEIGNSAFYNCVALSSVNLPDGVTKIGNSAFYGCTALKKIIIPSNVTVLEDSTFYGCNALATVKFSEELEEIKTRTFYNCKNLEVSSLPSKLKIIGSSAFQNCTKVEEMTIPSTVTSIGSSAFSNSVKILKFANGMTEIPSNACSGANLLQTVELPASITGIGSGAFYNCAVMASINLPDSLKKIGYRAFHGCGMLKKLIIPNNVTVLEESVFYNCVNLEEVKLSRNVEEIKSYAFYNCKKVVIDNLPAGLKTIGNNAFQNCIKVEEMTIPSSVTSIGSSAFANSLKKIKFANGMIEIPANACSGANLLETVELPSDITVIGNNAFSNCTALKTMDFLKKLVSIGSSAFQECRALEEVVIGDGVNIGRSAFRNCVGLKEIVIGNDCVIQSYAFSNCSSVEVFKLGNNIQREENCFSGIVLSGKCGNEVEYRIDFDSGEMLVSGQGAISDYSDSMVAPWNNFTTIVTTLLIEEGITKIGSSAFKDFKNVEGVEIPESVKEIGDSAFDSCETLPYIEIPENVSKVGKLAFAGCGKMSEMIFCGNAPSLGEKCITNSKELTVSTPMTATGWGNIVQQTYNLCSWQTWDDTAPKKDVILLLDVSGSMSGRMDQLKKAANAFVEGMKGRVQNTRIAVVSYHSSAKIEAQFTTSKYLLRKQINKLSAGGGTEYQRALDEAKALLETSGADGKSIVMFSDGEPNDSKDSIYALADELRKSYSIYTVGLLNSDSQRDILKRIAGDDARYFETDNIKGLLDAFKQLVKDFAREEDTLVSIQRHNVTYDLLKEESSFCIGSLEFATISVVPGNKLGDFAKVSILKGEEEIASNESGVFSNIQPGKVFGKDDVIYSAIYDADGKILEKLPLKITLTDGYLVTYMLNDGTQKMYYQEQVIGGMDVKKPQNPTRKGYDFSGWYASEECSGYSFFSVLNTMNRLKLESDITLYAKWVPNMYNDIWNFTNSSEYFASKNYEISEGDYAKLIWGLDAGVVEMIEEKKNSKWGGSCFGMSSVTVLGRAGDINVEQFDNKYHNIREAKMYKNKKPEDVGTVESMINFYFLRQYIGCIYDMTYDYTITNENESQYLNNILHKLKETNEPCIIGIDMLKDGENVGGHEVVGYNYQEKGKNEYSFDIYDCAFGPSKTYTVLVKCADGKYSKKCDSWINEWNNSLKTGCDDIYLETALSADDLKKENILVAPSILKLNNLTQSIGKRTLKKKEKLVQDYKLYTNYGSFTITDGSSMAKIQDGKLIEGTLNVSCRDRINEVGYDAEYLFELPQLSEGKQYRIHSITDNLDSYDTMIYSGSEDGFCSNVISAGKGEYIVLVDGTIQTSFADNTEQKVTVASNTVNTQWHTLTATGASKGLSIMPASDRFGVFSQDTASVDIEVKSSFNDRIFGQIPVSQKGVEIAEGPNGECEILSDGKIVTSADFGYAVVFDSQQGTNIDTLKGVKKDSLISAPEEPKKDGYIFAGWFKEKECITPWDFSVDSVTEDMVLYAGWELDANYFISVTFKVKGADNKMLFLSNGSKIAQEICPKDSSGTTITWYADDGCSVKWDYETVLNKNTVLYSKGWQEKKENSETNPEVPDNSSSDERKDDSNGKVSPTSGSGSGSTWNGGNGSNYSNTTGDETGNNSTTAVEPKTTASPENGNVTPTVRPDLMPTIKPSSTKEPVSTDDIISTPAPSSEAKADDAVMSTPKPNNIKKVGAFKYVITSSKKSKRTVSVYCSVKSTVKKVNIPKRIKIKGKFYKVTGIYANAFQDMPNLSKVTLSSNIKAIGAGAFMGCRDLKFLLLPKKVTTIGKQAFMGCKNLRYLVIRSSKIKKVGNQAFSNTSSKMKVKTPKNRWMTYAKLLRKNGLAKEVIFLIDPVKINYQGKIY